MKLTLKQWRMVRDLSRRQLGEIIHRSDMTIRNWESGKTAPTAKDIAELEKALDIEWADVIFMQ